MYIIIEGVDTTGKTTQIEMLKNVYPNAIYTKEPYKLRDMCINADDELTRALLFMADRNMHTNEVIKPNLDDWIISDRSFLSGIAYCDALDTKTQIEINKAISIMPDVVFILVIDKQTLSDRLKAKNELDKIESIGVDRMIDIQIKMIEISKAMRLCYTTIPSALDKNAIFGKIMRFIKSYQNYVLRQ